MAHLTGLRAQPMLGSPPLLDGALPFAPHAYHEPMIEQSERRVPAPVAAAALLLFLAGADSVGRAILTSDEPRVGGLLTGVLEVALGYGLWRGSGRARFWTTVLSTGSFLYGLVTFHAVSAPQLLQTVGGLIIVGLLLLPASSRRWFEGAQVTSRHDQRPSETGS